MIKKLFSVMLIFSVVFTLFTACGNKKAKKDDIQSAIDNIENLPVELDDDMKDLLNKTEGIDPGDSVPAASNPDIKVTVSLPEGWAETEDSTNIIASYSKETNMVMVMKGWAPSDVKNPADLAKYEKEQIKESFSDATFSDIESYKLSGIDASRISMDISLGKTLKQTQVYIYFEKGGGFYKIMAAYFSGDEQGENDIEAILESMKIE